MAPDLVLTSRIYRPGVRTPRPGYCEHKHKLLHDFLDAIRDLSVLLKQQTEAVIGGDADFSRFDLLIHMAQERKEKAKYAWMGHVEAHRCGGETL